MSAHEEKMASARAMAVFKAPYFASVIYGFIFQAVPGIKTMLVTRKLILGYDPQWAEEATVSHLATDIIHEVHHFVRRHFERAKNIDDPKRWNWAGDCAINQDLRAGGWDYHSTYLFPEHLDLPLGKSTEEYYDLLKQQKQSGGPPKKKKSPSHDGPSKQGAGTLQPIGQPQPGGQQPPQPGGGGGGGGTSAGSDQGEGEGEGESAGGNQDGGIGGGHCGGLGGHSGNEDIEAELNNEPDLGRNNTEVQSIEQRVAADIKAHVEAKGRGSLPANLLELLKAYEEPSCVRWQDELANVLRDATGRMQSGGDDFSRARPNKRSIMRGIIRPSMVEYLPEVAFIRDSSGSMGAPQLNAACREAYGVMQALGIDEVWFVDADTQIAMPWKRVGPQFFRSLTDAKGRGGTSFVQPLQSAQKLAPSPDLLVYFTDGDGTAPPNEPPGMAVVWCVVPGHYNKAPANWGHVVIISDDPRQRNKKVLRPQDVAVDDDDDEDIEL